MEQLTQMEYLQLHELLSAEELALKKCQAYAEQIQDDELMPYIEGSVTIHKEHLNELIELIRLHNGREEMQQ
jgi:fructose-bisphosphate aldolase class 1